MRRIKAIFNKIRAKLRFDDTHQRTAFGNIVKFFALMIILTLVARAASNAGTPYVTTAKAVRGTITQSVSVQGTVGAAGNTAADAPSGMTVKRISVKQGESVKKGQTLAAFDENEIKNSLAMKGAELDKLNVQLKQLNAAQSTDSSAVGAAQQALDWAYADYNAALGALNNLQAQDPVDADAVAAAQEKVNAALRTAQAAELSRNSALAAYNTADTAAKTTAQTNVADAEIMRLNIAEKQKEIDTLTQLLAADCALTAPVDGTVQDMKLAEGQPAGALACTLADAAQGYIFTFSLEKDNAKHAQTNSAITISQDGVSVDAKVSSVQLNTDGTAALSVRLPDAKWADGAASGKMTLSQKQYDMCVPSGAVHTDNAGSFVYVLEQRNTVLGEQTVLVRTPVTVDETGASQTAITAALTSMNDIAASSDKPLSDGARVRLRS